MASASRMDFDIRRLDSAKLCAHDITPAVEHVGGVDVDDRHVGEAIYG